MAPVRSSARRGGHQDPAPTQDAETHDPNANRNLFLDPMLGIPLTMYVEKDVDEKDAITQLITSHGGTVSQGYSGVTYILVDPHKPSGQNLWRQYSSKKGKIVLNAQWVRECVKANQLQTYHSDWAGCKVTGTETVYTNPRPPVEEPPAPAPPAPAAPAPARQMQAVHPHALQAPVPPAPVEHMNPYFQVYGAPPRAMPGAPPPPQAWPVAMPPPPHLHPPQPVPGPSHSQQHMMPRPSPGPSTQTQYREEPWQGYNAPEDMSGQPAPYDYRYREEQGGWVAGPGPYYEPTYEPGYGQPSYMDDPQEQSSGANSVTGQIQAGSVPPAGPSADAADKPRGRKRTRVQPAPAAPASSLVVSRNPPARSPTPPSRVIKSTYGGNLFTADDVMYLKKYIEYCQDQCLVLSLREICERIAVKAPHHTFYSWRRYCNKHQIRLGGYAMANDRDDSPMNDELAMDIDGEPGTSRQGPSASGPAAGPPTVRLDMAAATAAAAAAPRRDRSPTPPRALFRSTTGKGVAFTQEDVTFLIRFMEYRKSRGDLDMVAFWKDVATKAPHHSRASWMKFWRRHKHELSPNEGDEPLPAPPDKKMRYSKEDDALLAKYFFNKPDGTSDKIFQAFGRLHPHHPWKGWQEHHRIHKTKIEHLMQLIGQGEDIDAYIANES